MSEQGTPVGADPGTADNGQGNGLHEQFVSSAPEHLRDAARELVPTWDQYVQRQFTDNADYRKSWEPYESMGINQIDPQELQELLDFRDIVQDENAFRQWHSEIGDLLNPDGQVDDDDEFADPQVQQLQSQLQEMQGMMQQLVQDRESQQQQQVLQETAMQVRQELDALKKDNPDLTQEDEDYICTLALRYDSSDAIQRGFQDFQKLMGRAEKGVFNQKTDPALRVAPVSGGNNNTSAEPILSFEQAARAARERLRQNV